MTTQEKIDQHKTLSNQERAKIAAARQLARLLAIGKAQMDAARAAAKR